MKRNSRFSLALHTLGHMAADDRVRTSTSIAEHAGTNPVVVRRVLGKLREAELVTSEKGPSGGWSLARDPKDITLADIYTALGERLVATEKSDHSASCSIENALHQRVSSIMDTIEQSLIDRLSATTIEEVQAPENSDCSDSLRES